MSQPSEGADGMKFVFRILIRPYRTFCRLNFNVFRDITPPTARRFVVPLIFCPEDGGDTD
jgi:hypothetical protein